MCIVRRHHRRLYYLGEVVQGFVQVGMHAGWGFISNLDGVLQDALWDDVALGGGRWLGADKHPEALVASLCELLQKFLQSPQPASHQVDVLQGEQPSVKSEWMGVTIDGLDSNFPLISMGAVLLWSC